MKRVTQNEVLTIDKAKLNKKIEPDYLVNLPRFNVMRNVEVLEENSDAEVQHDNTTEDIKSQSEGKGDYYEENKPKGQYSSMNC